MGKVGKNHAMLMTMAWLMYTVTYLGKYSCNANVSGLMAEFNVGKGAAGLIPSCFFFAYGASQIINSFFCDRYNTRFIPAACMFISAALNVVVGFTKYFPIIKYLWIINGATLALIWPMLVKTLGENLNPNEMAKSVVIMGTTTPLGTAAAYGLSALLTELNAFRAIFYITGVIMPLLGLLWIVFYGKMTGNGAKAEAEAINPLETTNVKHKKFTPPMVTTIIMFGAFIAFVQIVKDGLQTWLPSLLQEVFGYKPSISLILTLILPLSGVPGTFVAVRMNKKIKNLIPLCLTQMAITLACVAVAYTGISLTLALLLIIGCVLGYCFIYGINNVMTNLFPLSLGKEYNIGFVSSLLNGLSYVGSTVSAYGLGEFSTKFGWNGMFILFMVTLGVLISVGTVIYFIFRKKLNNNPLTE